MFMGPAALLDGQRRALWLYGSVGEESVGSWVDKKVLSSPASQTYLPSGHRSAWLLHQPEGSRTKVEK